MYSETVLASSIIIHFRRCKSPRVQNYQGPNLSGSNLPGFKCPRPILVLTMQRISPAMFGVQFLISLHVFNSLCKMSTSEDTTATSSSAVWKKCHSQFTDVDDYRRHGNNMWQDQSGCYATSKLRTSAVPKTDTIPSRLL